MFSLKGFERVCCCRCPSVCFVAPKCTACAYSGVSVCREVEGVNDRRSIVGRGDIFGSRRKSAQLRGKTSFDDMFI